MKAYAGIGSRATPEPICALMSQVARRLGRRGWTLRSGGALGADRAFEQGALAVGAPVESYRPDKAKAAHEIAAPALPAFEHALALAERHHPAWGSLAPYVRALHARNGMQILGADLQQPCRFVLCWTPQYSLDAQGGIASVSGGTGQAVRVALAHGIPVFHLGLPAHRERVGQLLVGDE